LRKLFSFLIAGYLLFEIVMRPLLASVVESGNIIFLSRRRKGLHATWLLFDESLLEKITSVEDERSEAMRMLEERQRLQFGSEQKHEARLATLERIVPGWYHRNDENADQNKIVEEKLREAERIFQERGEKNHHQHVNPTKMDKPSNKANNARSANNIEDNRSPIVADQVEKPKLNGSSQSPPQNLLSDHMSAEIQDNERRLSHSSDHMLPGVRTLHNMHLFRNQSRCPLDFSSESFISTTLVVQSTVERLWIMRKTCQRWKDPIILVLFLDSPTTGPGSTTSALLKECAQLTIIYHEVDVSLGEDHKERYPVNRLRNIGLDAVNTSHVLMMDVDFVPSSGLEELIRSALVERNNLRKKASNTSNVPLFPSEDRDAIVVPAFERIHPSELCQGPTCVPWTRQALTNLSLPASFNQLRSCVVEQKNCRVFQSNNNWDGHSSTRSKGWLNGVWYDGNRTDASAVGSHAAFPSREQHSARIRSISCFDSVRYEPYVVLRWCPSSFSHEGSSARGPVAPYYDERFHGYGKNKIQLISHLRVMGYAFSILPEGFIIHSPHSVSNAKVAWESTKNSTLHSSMDKLYPKFLKELLAFYKKDKRKIIDRC